MAELPNRTITFHAARFDRQLGKEDATDSPPEGCVVWVSGSDVDWLSDGTPKRRRRHRYWLAVWESPEAARRMVSAPARHLPLMEEAVEAWSVALHPYMHRGSVNWEDVSSPPTVFGALKAKPEPGTPIVVITSLALFEDPAKAAAFGRTIVGVRESALRADGLLAEMQLLPDDPFRTDPATFSLWRDEAAALAWAYRTDPHKAASEANRTSPLMPRSSFARLTIKQSSGRWNGVDPVVEAR